MNNNFEIKSNHDERKFSDLFKALSSKDPQEFNNALKEIPVKPEHLGAWLQENRRQINEDDT